MTKIAIPEAALNKHIAILGMNGSGKTSVAKSQIIEPALAAGERVCNIDPTGVGWGLRLSATGKSKGYPIYIVGGMRADFALFRRDGKAWAEIVGTSSDSFVFDTSQMTVSDRSIWFTDFAETVLRLNKGPLKLVIDEAHLFAPKAGAQGGGVVPAMLHATNNLLALGRSRGFRVTMISQRPAKLHNDSLTQAHTLIAMMLMAPHDRRAVKDWIDDQADEAKGAEIIKSLPTLNPGEGWVWAPREKLLDRVKFARPQTFDSSSAPDDDSADAVQLSPINPDAIKTKLATVAKETVANDPATLRAEIARLKAEMAKAPTLDTINIGTMIDAVRGKGYVVLTDADLTADAERQTRQNQELVKAALEPLMLRFGGIYHDLGDAVPKLLKALRVEHIKFASGSPAVIQPSAPAPRAREERAPTSAAESADTPSLTGPERKIIDSLGSWRAMGHHQPSNAQAAWLAGYSPSSTSYTNPRGALKTKGLIEYPSGDHLQLTDAGVAIAQADDPGELVPYVLSLLPGPEARILRVIAEKHPSAISNAEAAEGAGYSPKSTSYTNPRGSLRSKELITYPSPDQVKAAEWLFR